MAIQPDEIERGGLLEALAPEGVTNAKLLRWVQAGLLPRPRREGLGQGQGGVSYYPRIAVRQAKALAELLRRQRSLDEAGWRLWLVGYPVTPFARALLLKDLAAEERVLREELAREKRGEPRRIAAALTRNRGDASLTRLEGMLSRSGLQTMGRILVEQRLGTLDTSQYSDDALEAYGDATIAMLWPELVDHPGLAGLDDFRAGLQQLSNDASIGRLRALVREADDKLLVVTRNEVQWLMEYFRDPLASDYPFAERGDFLRVLRLRMEPEGPKRMAQLMKALGHTRVPPSPLQRALQGRGTPPSTASPDE